MKRLMMTTAAFIAFSAPAFADGHISSIVEHQLTRSDMFASELIGMRVYGTETGVDPATAMMAGDEVNWDDIGEINDMVIASDGTVAAVVIGVGGFLGMGEKDVALDFSQISVMRESDDADDKFLVIQATADTLDAAPAFAREMPMTEEAHAADTSLPTPVRDMLVPPSVARDGYVTADRADLTAAMLTGAVVYGANDENVGEISALLLGADGAIDRAVIDVGGFLGMGEKQVAVTFEELTILREDGGNSVSVYIDATQTALEAQPTYEE